MASLVAGWPQETPRQIWNRAGGSSCFFSSIDFASSTWPASKTSSSGTTPAACAAAAISARWAGVLAKIISPMFMLPMSRLQMSGLNAWIWRTRSAGRLRVVPGPGSRGSSAPGWKRPPAPVVRLMMTSTPLSRMRSTTSR